MVASAQQASSAHTRTLQFANTRSCSRAPPPAELCAKMRTRNTSTESVTASAACNRGPALSRKPWDDEPLCGTDKLFSDITNHSILYGAANAGRYRTRAVGLHANAQLDAPVLRTV